ncbi:hypothetical protein GCM10022631_02750 [Deinococcus rubellus]|uniref:hypothetical protein n=1 Tax=Deinococcus rubellus TaxID=1889240 RepID=UPI0031E64365
MFLLGVASDVRPELEAGLILLAAALLDHQCPGILRAPLPRILVTSSLDLSCAAAPQNDDDGQLLLLVWTGFPAASIITDCKPTCT